jgi:hypothetical protein
MIASISSTGCLVEATAPILRRANPVRIKITGFSSIDGMVVWDDGRRVGIAFAVALHPAVVAYIAEKATAEIACDEPPCAADG